MNNVKGSIGWADYTFNPVVGCKRGCKYCYARRIHRRFSTAPFSDISFFPNRLRDRMPKKPSRIFVGSMSDIEYWPRHTTSEIIMMCEKYPQHTFMFLSKSCLAYDGFTWPENTMQGLTNTCENSQDNQFERVMAMIRHTPRPFLSIEPLLGKLKILSPMRLLEQVIVGAMTGPGAVEPKSEWIQSIKDNVPSTKIYWKKNIRGYL